MTTTELDTIDPISGEPVTDEETHFLFPGVPAGFFPKDVGGKMSFSAEQYAQMLSGDAVVEPGLNEFEKRVWTWDEESQKATVKHHQSRDVEGVKNPFGEMPIQEKEGSYLIPGFRAWKELPKQVGGTSLPAQEWADLASGSIDCLPIDWQVGEEPIKGWLELSGDGQPQLVIDSRCPLSEEPIRILNFEHGPKKAIYQYPGLEHLDSPFQSHSKFPQELKGRSMSPDDYTAIINGETPWLDGFSNGGGEEYSGQVDFFRGKMDGFLTEKPKVVRSGMTPLSRELGLDYGDHFRFESMPDTKLPKIAPTMNGGGVIELSAKDYQALLSGKSIGKSLKETGVKLNGGESIAGEPIWVPGGGNDGYGGIDCWRATGAIPLDVFCPATNKPMIDRGAGYEIPGYPNVKFLKVLGEGDGKRREMKPEEYVTLLTEGNLESLYDDVLWDAEREAIVYSRASDEEVSRRTEAKRAEETARREKDLQAKYEEQAKVTPPPEKVLMTVTMQATVMVDPGDVERYRDLTWDDDGLLYVEESLRYSTADREMPAIQFDQLEVGSYNADEHGPVFDWGDCGHLPEVQPEAVLEDPPKPKSPSRR